MAEDWDFYMAPVDDQPASIFVDLSQLNAAPDTSRPHLLRVGLKMKSVREDGLSEDEETEVLYAIEDALFAAVARGLGARYVGRVTTQGQREHYYYGKSAAGFTKAVETAMKEFAEYEFVCFEQADPDWDAYCNLLYPSDLDMQTIQNRRVVDQLSAGGDDLSQPRDVDHWLYFPSEHSRDQFLSQVQSDSFTIETFTREEADSEYPHGVHLVRQDRVDLESIDALVIDLFLRAQNAGGEYAGWGSARKV